MNKFFNENKKLFLIILSISIIIPIIILTSSSIGIIEYETSLTLIGYCGSILGGFLTLYGVWWTIKDQEDKRKKDLAIQYRPFLICKYDSKDPDFAKSFKDDMHSTFQGVCALRISENWRKIYKFTFKIKNIGDGECYISCKEIPFTSSNYDSLTPLMSLLHDSPIKVDQNWHNVIGRKQEIYFYVLIFYNDKDKNKNDNMPSITIPMKYTDQFDFKTYNASLLLSFKTDVKENQIEIDLNSTSLLNKEIDN
ncbi:MAG: hypothetical protein ACLRT4_13995 [Thomasclavelia sp.]